MQQSVRLIFSFLVLIAALQYGKALPSGIREERSAKLWSDWSVWSACSRSCGSGVTTQNRSCINGCDRAEESEIRYQSCCIQECPEGTMDFLLQQCLGAGKGNWTSAVKDAGECGAIHCQKEVAGSIQTLSVGVAPGTPCTPKQGGRGMCLGNYCAVLGCDGTLGSKHEEDMCLNCFSPDAAAQHQNQAASCQTRRGVYPPSASITTPPPGDIAVLILREAYTSINISHPFNQREGRLALSSPTTREYFFRGGNSGTEFDVDGVRFHYRIVQESGDALREELTARGPLSQDIRVEIQDVAKGASPVVSYTYHLYLNGKEETESGARNHTHSAPPPITDNPSSSIAEFVWQHQASECSATCGRGLRILEPMCVDIGVYPERTIDSRYCKSADKPQPIVEMCHLRNCSASWKAEEWSLCSQECGRGGQQSRRVQCKQQVVPAVMGGEELEAVDPALCDPGSKPAEVRECNVHSCNFTWATGEWSECSEERVDGVQERTVECQERALGQVAGNPTHCGGIPKPNSVRVCRLANCREDGKCYTWRTRRWWKCDNACGYGNQTRKIVCQQLDSKGKVNESFCAGLERPPTERECWDTRGSKCSPHWDAGSYGQCNGGCCEDQFRQRTVQCVDIKNGELIPLPDEACANQTKPDSKQACAKLDCPSWRIGDWGNCSGRCDQLGVQTRVVACESASGQRLQHAECCERQPEESRFCHQTTPCSTTPSPAPPTTPHCTDRLSFCKDFSKEECTSSLFRDACCLTCSM